MILRRLPVIKTHLNYRNISIWIKMFYNRPRSVIESPVYIQSHIGIFNDTFNFLCKFRISGCGILNLVQLFRESAKVVNGFWFFHCSNKGAVCFPVSRYNNNCIRFWYFFTNFSESLYKFIFFNCIHRAAVTKKQHRHFIGLIKLLCYFI